MPLRNINRANIKKLEAEVSKLSGEVENIDPVVDDSSFPDIEPEAPRGVRAVSLFRNILVMWDYDDSSYISAYEVFASQEKGFSPRMEHLVWRGKASGFTHNASTGETWYFRVRAKNYHDTYSVMSPEVEATTVDISGFEIEEKYKIDLIEYTNQYTDELRDEIMEDLADKVGFDYLYNNFLLKEDAQTIEDRVSELSDELESKVDSSRFDSAVGRIDDAIESVEGVVTALDTRSDELFDLVSENEDLLYEHGGRIVDIEENIDEIEGNISTVIADLNATDEQVSLNKTAIQQNANEISLKASQEDLDIVTGDIESLSGELDIQAGLISAKAERSELERVDGEVTSVKSDIANLNISYENIELSVASLEQSVTEHGDSISSALASIDILSDSIELMVTRTEFEDLEGDVSEVRDTVSSLEISVDGIIGEISSIEATIGEHGSTISNNTSRLSVLEDEISTFVKSTTYDEDIDGIITRIESNESAITQNAEEIDLRVRQVTFDELEDRVSEAESSITINTESIQQKVSQTTYDEDINDGEHGLFARMESAEGSITTLANEIDLRVTEAELTTRIGDVVHELEQLEAIINVQADAIEQRVTKDTYNALENRVTSAEGSITTLAGEVELKASQVDLDNAEERLSIAEATLTVLPDEIEARVEKDGVISSINQSPESVKISAAMVHIDGDLVVDNGLVRLKDAIIDSVHIKDNALVGRMFADEVITNRMIAGDISGEKINVDSLSAISAHLGSVKTGNIETLTISGGDKKIYFGDSMDENTFEGRIDYVGNQMRFQRDRYTYYAINPGGHDGMQVPATHNLHIFYMGGGDRAVRFGLVEDFRHVFLSTGNGGGIKFLQGDLDEIQFRLSGDTGYSPIRASDATFDSLHFSGGNVSIDPSGGNARFKASAGAYYMVTPEGFHTMMTPGGVASFRVSPEGNAHLLQRLNIQSTGVNSGIHFPNDHIIASTSTGNFYWYGNRAEGNPFTVRSHANRSSYRNDFIINTDGEIVSTPTRDNPVTWGGRVAIGASSGRFGFVSSSERYKLAIEDISSDPYNLLDISPKSWYDKTNTEGIADMLTRQHRGEDVDFSKYENITRIPGLIAEDVKRVGLDEFVTYNAEGEVDGVQYDRLWILLIPIVKDLVTRIEELESMIQ